MDFPFWKMHGAGNDFILADDRACLWPLDNPRWIARLCHRSLGIGSDGLILVRPPRDGAHFRMLFFNPDGHPAAMCGNGMRCVARLAAELGIAPPDMQIETDAGPHRATVLDGNQVRIQMPAPRDFRTGLAFGWHGDFLTLHAIDSGVPHAALLVEGDLGDVEVQELGAAIRHSPHFDPEGTNADFLKVVARNVIDLRTYERGVEAETLACGTGAVAAAAIAARLGLVDSAAPVRVHTAGGDTLSITLDPGTTLTGPAVHVFRGTVPAP